MRIADYFDGAAGRQPDHVVGEVDVPLGVEPERVGGGRVEDAVPLEGDDGPVRLGVEEPPAAHRHAVADGEVAGVDGGAVGLGRAAEQAAVGRKIPAVRRRLVRDPDLAAGERRVPHPVVAGVEVP